MSEALVSIIIPTYNVERYVEECLNSVLKQSYERMQVIVVDDGSTDATPYLLKAYDGKAELILNKNNTGQGAARNQGISLANGEYILFVDADDWIDPETVKLLVEQAEKKEVELVRFNGKPFFEGDDDSSKKNNYNFSSVLDAKTFYTDGGLLEANRKAYSASPCLYLVKKAVLDEHDIRFPEGVLHEDEYFTTKLFISIKNMAFVDKELYHRRYRIASTMTEITPAHRKRSFESYLTVFRLLDGLYQSEKYNTEQKAFLKRQLMSIFHGLQQSKVDPILKKELKKLKTITLKDRLHIEVSKIRQLINNSR